MSDVRDYVNNYGQKVMVFNLYGLNVVDYMQLYRQRTFVNQESYSLDHISHIELDKQKIDYSEYGNSIKRKPLRHVLTLFLI